MSVTYMEYKNDNGSLIIHDERIKCLGPDFKLISMSINSPLLVLIWDSPKYTVTQFYSGDISLVTEEWYHS